jgi:AcrR family transcriptional regulator
MNASAPDGRRLRWQRHKEERRRAVIDAAIAVLEQRAPGAEIHVHEIAAHAGMNRSVVYRHFDDRTDLDLAVQQEICDRAGEVMLRALTLEGTPRELIRRIVAAYIRWAVAHPALVRFAEQDLPGAPRKPLDDALELVAQQIEGIIAHLVEALGAELAASDRDALEPWVFGLIGGCFEAVRRWTARDEGVARTGSAVASAVPVRASQGGGGSRGGATATDDNAARHVLERRAAGDSRPGDPFLSPDVEAFVDLMTAAMWYQIDGLATERGIRVPDLPVDELIASLEPASGVA